MSSIEENRRANLRKLKEDGGRGSLAALARKLGKTSQHLSNLMNKGSFGEKVARDIERSLGMLPGALDLPPDQQAPVRSFCPEEEQLPTGFVSVPEYTLEFSAGTGGEPTEPEWCIKSDSVPAWYRADFFQNMHVNPDRCRRAKVHGDSMEPFIYDGDTILFEEFLSKEPRANHIYDGDIYVITLNGDYRVKRLAKCQGGLIVYSDNPRFKEERYVGENCDNSIRVYGHVLEVSRSLARC